MDSIFQVGKKLRANKDTADKAFHKKTPSFPIAETIRDIFDRAIPFSAYFKVPRANTSVSVSLRFELPPASLGLGDCCADCFCSICEKYIFTDAVSREILTTYPYLAGTVRAFDALGMPWKVIETDPSAGIINLGYDPIGDSNNIIHICYVYNYEENCTS